MADQELLDRLYAFLAAARQDAVGTMAEAVRRQVPAYAAVADGTDAQTWEAVVAGIASMYDLSIARVCSGQPLSDEALAQMRRVARDRAEQGIPLTALLQSARCCIRIGLEHIEEFQASLEPPQALALAQLVTRQLMSHQDDVLSTMSDSYNSTKEVLVSQFERRRAATFTDFFNGDFPDEQTMVQRAADAGYDMRGSQGVLIVTSADGDAEPHVLRGQGAALLRRLPRSCPSLPQLSGAEAHVAVLVPAFAGAQVCEAVAACAQPHGLLVVGIPPVHSLRRLHGIYAEHVRMLPLARRVFPAGQLAPEDLHVLRLVAQLPTAEVVRWVERQFEQVLQAGDPRAYVMFETLAVYYATGSMALTASQLGCDERTVSRRLETLGRLAGARHDQQRATLELGLMLLPLLRPRWKSLVAARRRSVARPRPAPRPQAGWRPEVVRGTASAT